MEAGKGFLHGWISSEGVPMKKGIRRLLVAMAVCAGVVGLAPPAVWGAGSGHPGTRKGLGLCRLRFGRSHLYRVAFHRLAVSGLIVMADLGNGHEDIVEGNRFWDVITVFYGEGDGRIGRIQNFPLTKHLRRFNGVRGLVVADLGNGHPDIIATGNRGVYVLYGTGGGTVWSGEEFPGASCPFPCGSGSGERSSGHLDGRGGG